MPIYRAITRSIGESTCGKSNNKFVSLLLRFLITLKLTSFMQATFYDIRFVVNKGDRSIRCFNWKTTLKKNLFFFSVGE